MFIRLTLGRPREVLRNALGTILQVSGEIKRDIVQDNQTLTGPYPENMVVKFSLVHRIEKGEMGCSIGATFEVAAIAGLRLFDSEPATLSRYLSMERDKITLLPKSVRTAARKVKDDF